MALGLSVGLRRLAVTLTEGVRSAAMATACHASPSMLDNTSSKRYAAVVLRDAAAHCGRCSPTCPCVQLGQPREWVCRP
jgi:hypothetical protein